MLLIGAVGVVLRTGPTSVGAIPTALALVPLVTLLPVLSPSLVLVGGSLATERHTVAVDFANAY